MTPLEKIKEAGFAVDMEVPYTKVIRVISAFEEDRELYPESNLINNNHQAVTGLIRRLGKPSSKEREFLMQYNRGVNHDNHILP